MKEQSSPVFFSESISFNSAPVKEAELDDSAFCSSDEVLSCADLDLAKRTRRSCEGSQNILSVVRAAQRRHSVEEPPPCLLIMRRGAVTCAPLEVGGALTSFLQRQLAPPVVSARKCADVILFYERHVRGVKIRRHLHKLHTRNKMYRQRI
jgi:hypothetical protein